MGEVHFINSNDHWDFTVLNDFDAILSLIDEDYLSNDPEFSAEVNVLVDSIPEETLTTTFPCCECNKVCLSKSGLTRHNRSKHQAQVAICDKKPKLHPLELKKLLITCVGKLAVDECYPSNITDEVDYKM